MIKQADNPSLIPPSCTPKPQPEHGDTISGMILVGKAWTGGKPPAKEDYEKPDFPAPKYSHFGKTKTMFFIELPDCYMEHSLYVTEKKPEKVDSHYKVLN